MLISAPLVSIRCGIAAYWVKELRNISNRDPLTTNSEADLPWKSYFWGADFTQKEAKITAGLGLRRGRGTFDISVDFMKWKNMGVFSGPPAGLATLTVDIGPSK